jgi:hypothetical protein
MLRTTLALVAAAAVGVGSLHAQVDSTHTPSKATMTLPQVGDSVRGLDKRMGLLEKALSGLKGLKVSGYVQTEWEHFDQTSSSGGRALYSDARKNFVTIRRGRIKFHQKIGDAMSVTIQPDLTESGVTMKDAYLTLDLLDDDALRLDAGSFNRPNYEVELSSSVREVAERSQIVRAFSPTERDLGAMLTVRPRLGESFTPRLQLGLFNGPGVRPEIDAFKDLMGRLTATLPLGADAPVKVDVGASYYYGGIPQTGRAFIEWSDGRQIVSGETGSLGGWGNNRNYGVESQITMSILPIGTTTVRAELLSGQRATPGAAATPATVGTVKTAEGIDSIRVVPGSPAGLMAIRRQMGYYVYLVQNLGKDFQLGLRYDALDRNTDVAGTEVMSASDASSSVLAVGLDYFWRNFRLMLCYEIPRFAAGEAIQVDPATKAPVDALRDEDLKDNKTRRRLRARFFPPGGGRPLCTRAPGPWSLSMLSLLHTPPASRSECSPIFADCPYAL